MEEIRFDQFQDFIRSLGLSDAKAAGDLFILRVEDVSKSFTKEFSLFRNEFYELALGTERKELEFAVDGDFYPPSSEPFVYFITPNQLQSYKVLKDSSEAKGYIIYFSRLIYQKLLKQGIDLPFFKREVESYHQLTRAEYGILAQWAELMVLEYTAEKQTPDVLLHLLGILALKSKSMLKEVKNAYSSRPEEVVDNFINLLQKSTQHQSVSHYADEMALTPKQLNTITKKVLNKTALSLIRESTVSKAKALILQSKLTLTEIAYQVGIDELSNFSRLFKSVTGSSPNQFKEKGQNG